MSRQIQLSRVIPASGHFHAYPLVTAFRAIEFDTPGLDL